MTVGATRAKDRQDVPAMRPTGDELAWVGRFLASIAGRGDVTMARLSLETLREERS